MPDTDRQPLLDAIRRTRQVTADWGYVEVTARDLIALRDAAVQSLTQADEVLGMRVVRDTHMPRGEVRIIPGPPQQITVDRPDR